MVSANGHRLLQLMHLQMKTKLKMTARERLFAILNGEQTDHVPIWLLFPYHATDYYIDVREHPKYKIIFEVSKKYAIMLNRRSLGAAPHAPKLQLRMSGLPLYEKSVNCYRKESIHQSDRVIKDIIEYRSDRIYEETCYSKDGTRVKKPLNSIEQLEYFCSLPIETDQNRLHEALEDQLPVYLKEKEEFPLDYGAMMLDMGEPILPLYFAANLDEYPLWSITHNSLVKKFLDRVMERLRIIYRWCLEHDLADVYFLVGSELASPPMFSPATFREWIVPYASEIIDVIHSYDKKVVQHYHGQIKEILPEFLTMAPDALQTIEAPPIGNCTIQEAFSIVQDKMTLIGNIQYDDFYRFNSEQMKRAVVNVLDECKGQKFILSPTAGPYLQNISDEMIQNYIVLMETAWQYKW